MTAVDVTAGAAASAGSTAFVIAGLDSYDVVASVPVTDMPALKVGQRASVLPNGTSTPVSGTVVAIGLVPNSTGSTTTYPVTIGLAGQPVGLHSGGFASVTITTAHSSGVSVPTSAIHGTGRSATVTVDAGGQVHVTNVKVGTMGPVMTRIVSGLRSRPEGGAGQPEPAAAHQQPERPGPARRAGVHRRRRAQLQGFRLTRPGRGRHYRQAWQVAGAPMVRAGWAPFRRRLRVAGSPPGVAPVSATGLRCARHPGRREQRSQPWQVPTSGP